MPMPIRGKARYGLFRHYRAYLVDQNWFDELFRIHGSRGGWRRVVSAWRRFERPGTATDARSRPAQLIVADPIARIRSS
jgi:hypothetical protein